MLGAYSGRRAPVCAQAPRIRPLAASPSRIGVIPLPDEM